MGNQQPRRVAISPGEAIRFATVGHDEKVWRLLDHKDRDGRHPLLAARRPETAITESWRAVPGRAKTQPGPARSQEKREKEQSCRRRRLIPYGTSLHPLARIVIMTLQA